jgi:hypothetical protein
MTRWIVVSVLAASLSGCAGAGIGLVPRIDQPSSARLLGERQTGTTHVRMQMTIPRPHRRDRDAVHPSTVSPMTQSVGISINGGAQHLFNAMPSSPSCAVVATKLMCTFQFAARVGTDAFVVRTYSGLHGSGTILDQGKATVNIVAGKRNFATITLGPVVTTALDSGMGSLRYAVGSANPGDTILFLLPTPRAIVLSAPITLSRNITLAGPGVTTSIRRPKTVYSGITISGSNAHQLFVVAAGATVAMTGLIFAEGSADIGFQPGGAINNSGVLSLAGDVFFGNSSTVQSAIRVRPPAIRDIRGTRRVRRPHACSPTYEEGGAVYNNGTLNVTSSTFDLNAVRSNVFGATCFYGFGGAIYNDQLGALAVAGSKFVHNSAYGGGAVYNNGSLGQASFTNDVFDANAGCTASNGCTTSGCSGNGCSTFAIGEGAAILDFAGPGAVITKSTFTSNAVGGATSGSIGLGGAVSLHTGTPKITNSTFSDNSAGGGPDNCSVGDGGAIYAVAPVELDDDAFSKNRAAGDNSGSGAAVYSFNAVSGSGDTFASNTASGTGSACSPGAAEGGALSVQGKLTLTASTFTGNLANSNYQSQGGAIVSGDASLMADTFTNNAVLSSGTNASIAYGGAIYVLAGKVVMSGNKFTSNSAKLAIGSTGVALGGAIACAQLTSTGDSFAANSAVALHQSLGGAVYVIGTALLISKDTFSSNASKAAISQGGALYARAPGTVSNSTFASNVAGTHSQAGYGGAIYDYSGIALAGSKLSNNSATSAGGGLFNLAFDGVSNSTVTGNKVTSAPLGYGGGGIYSEGGTGIADSTISVNSVKVIGSNAGGGGLYNFGALVMSGSTISGNSVSGKAVGSGGGGVFNANAASVSNTTIVANSSSIDGGGYETFGNHGVTLTNVTLYRNKASGRGGNIANLGGIQLAADIVAGGSAAAGPDVQNAGPFTDKGYNVFQQRGLATGTDLTGDPKLLALASNGGPTLTLADQASSPGRARIPIASCLVKTDQRHFKRGAGGKCDVGAFEYAGVASAIGAPR